MSTSDTESEESLKKSNDQAESVPIDEKEQLLQRRLARLEEALGLKPLT